MTIEVNLVRLCPYCRERRIKKKTCGDPVCQYKHHVVKMKEWWKGPGKVFNGKRQEYSKNRYRKLKAVDKLWEQQNPKKKQVQNIVHKALRDKIITKPLVCQKCGIKSNLDAHHENYNKPLEIIWLCRSCHSTLHFSIF